MRSERLKKKLSKKAASSLKNASGYSVCYEDSRCWVYIPGYYEGDHREAWEYLADSFDATFNICSRLDDELGFGWVDKKDELRATPARVFAWARLGLPSKTIMDQAGIY